jgi:hypothetical protein
MHVEAYGRTRGCELAGKQREHNVHAMFDGVFHDVNHQFP